MVRPLAGAGCPADAIGASLPDRLIVKTSFRVGLDPMVPRDLAGQGRDG